MLKHTTVLGIETAIQGGSLSLLREGSEIDFWIGEKNISKAEDVLEQISEILKKNNLKKVDLIAVSTGPGSATGLRIGLATAYGLRKSWDCGIIGIPAFGAVLLNKKFAEELILAIPFGRSQVAWQVFENDTISPEYQMAEIKFGNVEVFLELLESRKFTKIILHNKLKKIISENGKNFEMDKIEILDDKFATYIAVRGKADKMPKDMRPIMMKSFY